MKLLIIFVLALAITVPVPTAHGQGRILNGQDAELGQFRYQARLDLEDEKGNFTSCGGSLISRNYILTAAHCLVNIVIAIVYLGAIKRFEAEVYSYASHSNFTMHPRFNSIDLENDIALIKIPTVKLTKNIKLVKLPKLTETRNFRNEKVIVTGWGRKGNSELLPLTNLLKSTRLTVLRNIDCRWQYISSTFNHPVIKRSNLCAYSPISRTCAGDSGGPVVLAKTKQQVAIVSWGSPGCKAEFPSVFVRVTYFLQWIKDNSDVKL